MTKTLFTLLCALACQILPAQNAAKPFAIGEILEIPSKALGEQRTLNIYLPEGYTDTAKYPVIYLLDGSADEDFIHVAGLVQFCNFPWVDILPPSIVVGIANVDRRRDYTFPTSVEQDKKNNPTSGGSEAFIRFLETEVQPFIEKRYRTAGEKTIIGQSLGGLLATEVLFKKPQLFDRYIIISPSLWWNDESLLALPPAVLAPGFARNTSVYVAVGKEGKVMVRDAKKLARLLRQGKKPNVRVQFAYFGAENHASIMHAALYEGFLRLKSKK